MWQGKVIAPEKDHARKRRVANVGTLCEPCTRGEHPTFTHGELGCMQALARGENRDYLCRCVVGQSTAPVIPRREHWNGRPPRPV